MGPFTGCPVQYPDSTLFNGLTDSESSQILVQTVQNEAESAWFQVRRGARTLVGTNPPLKYRLSKPLSSCVLHPRGECISRAEVNHARLSRGNCVFQQFRC